MYLSAAPYLPVPSYPVSASITKHSAPFLIACAATFASSPGRSPLTYCQPHTCSAPAFKAETKRRLNCSWPYMGSLLQNPVVSPLLTKTVRTLCACARLMIALAEPPLLATYQIHIPVPSKGVDFVEPPAATPPLLAARAPVAVAPMTAMTAAAAI